MMNLPVDAVKLKKGLMIVGLFFVIAGVGIGGYYLGMRTAASQLQPAATEESEGPSYLTNPFSTEEGEEATENPFYQNPFRTIKGLYTEKSE